MRAIMRNSNERPLLRGSVGRIMLFAGICVASDAEKSIRRIIMQHAQVFTNFHPYRLSQFTNFIGNVLVAAASLVHVT